MDALLLIAKYSSIIKLSTTTGSGANEIFVDSGIVPANSVGFLTALSDGHPSVLSVPIGCFLCDGSLHTYGSSPLGTDNATLDPNKIGPLIGSDNSTLNVLGVMMQQNYVFLAPNQFLRFSTFSGPAAFPAAGNVVTIRMALSIVPLCEC